VGPQEVKWDKVRAGDYIIFYEKVNENRQLETEFYVHHRIGSAFKKVGFVCDRTYYIVLRGGWCNIIVLRVHAPSKKKNCDSKDRFYEELGQVFFLLF